MAEYKIQFEIFEGPLDLLLYLVKKQEVDIYEVNLTRIASQFLEYVEMMRRLDLEVAGEFLVMAATLMYIKSRELLPVEQQAPDDEEGEIEDPRWELIRQLVEYKKFKEAAYRLQAQEAAQEHIYPRRGLRVDLPPVPPPPRPEVSVFTLIEAVNSVIERVQQRGQSREIFADNWTVSEKIAWLQKRLEEANPVQFLDLFADATQRTEVIVTFLALLELVRLKRVRVIQAEPFGEIQVFPVVGSSLEGEPPGASAASFTGAADPSAVNR